MARISTSVNAAIASQTPFHLERVQLQEGVLDVQPLVERLYLLLSMAAHLGSGRLGWNPTTDAKHAAFERRYDFQLMARELAAKAAPGVLQYLVAASEGELSTVEDGPDWAHGNYIDIRYQVIRREMTYQQYGQAAKDVFEQGDFAWGYGGGAWARIADAIASYDCLRPEIWLDHVFDLEHNFGTVFAASAGRANVKIPELRKFMAFRAGKQTDPVRMVEFIERELGHPAPSDLREMALTGRRIGVW